MGNNQSKGSYAAMIQNYDAVRSKPLSDTVHSPGSEDRTKEEECVLVAKSAALTLPELEEALIQGIKGQPMKKSIEAKRFDACMKAP